MKITIEPTAPYVGPHPYLTVSVSHPSDTLTADEAVNLMRAALIAYGYHPDIIPGEGEDE